MILWRKWYEWRWYYTWPAIWWMRLRLWSLLVGRVDQSETRMGPMLAWQVACIVHNRNDKGRRCKVAGNKTMDEDYDFPCMYCGRPKCNHFAARICYGNSDQAYRDGDLARTEFTLAQRHFAELQARKEDRNAE